MPLAKELGKLTKEYIGIIYNKLNNLDIERSYYVVMLVGQHEGSLSQNDLAILLDMDKVSVVRVLNYLEENKCIIRRPDPSDKRAHLLKLTSKGKRLYPKIVEAFDQADERCFDGFTHEEREQFNSFIDRISDNLQTTPRDDVKLRYKKISG